MARSRSPNQVNFTVQINSKAKNSFESLHRKLGLKKRGLTFEALVLSASLKDVIDPREIAEIRAKLDHLIALLQTP